MEDNEVVYIATDEKDKELFKPFRERYRVRFLSDYFERAAVGEMNQNYVGMLEQVCTAQSGRVILVLTLILHVTHAGVTLSECVCV